MACIVFDLDGTLIDSAPDINGIANRLLLANGYAEISLLQTRDFIGNGAGVFVQKMCDARGIPFERYDELLAQFIAAYDDAVHLTTPYPGVVEALIELRGAGHKLGVCTNKPIKPTRAVLNHLNLARFFDTVWGGDSLSVHKPDPAPLNAAFERLGGQNELFVGDSDVDADTALAANVPFFLFSKGYRKSPVEQIPHTVSFSDFTTLPRSINRVLDTV
ncbi:MAG: HAD-IA family hydrolase [Pseudoruegeria sp.]